MFKLIAIETIPAPVDYAQCYPDIPEGLSEMDIEIAKAKKERYDSTMRLLSAQDMNRRYLFCREYHFDKDGQLVRGTSLLPENFYNQKHDDKEIQINICAVVGKNGSGKSSLLELLLRMLNNTAYALRAGIDNNGSYDLRFVDGVFARLYIERPDGTLVRIEQKDAEITMSDATYGTIAWRYDYRTEEQRNEEEARNWENLCKSQLSSLFYTIMVDYSAYGFNDIGFVSRK